MYRIQEALFNTNIDTDGYDIVTTEMYFLMVKYLIPFYWRLFFFIRVFYIFSMLYYALCVFLFEIVFIIIKFVFITTEPRSPAEIKIELPSADRKLLLNKQTIQR